MRFEKRCDRGGNHPGRVRYHITISLRMLAALLLLAGLCSAGVFLVLVGESNELRSEVRQLRGAHDELKARSARQASALQKIVKFLPRDPNRGVIGNSTGYVAAYGHQAETHLEIARLFARREHAACLEKTDSLLANADLVAPIRRDLLDKRAWSLLHLGRTDEALEAARKLAAAYADDPSARHAAADIFLAADRRGEAEGLLTPLVKNTPNALNHFSMGRLRRAQGNFREADAYFRYVLANGDMRLAELAAAELALMKVEDELEFARGNYFTNVLVQLAPGTPRTHVTVARILLLQKRTEQAREVLEAALQSTPAHPVLLVQMAMLRRLEGKDARPFLEKAGEAGADADAMIARLEADIARFQKRVATRPAPANDPAEP